jgi:predicted DNA-binding transcriptional regulator AlpA
MTDTNQQEAETDGFELDEQGMLTMAEVARFLRLPVATLRYWRHIGEGPRSFKIGRHVRYWAVDVWTWAMDRSDDPHNNQ